MQAVQVLNLVVRVVKQYNNGVRMKPEEGLLSVEQ
jgi:hypothetical protein